MLKHSTLSPDYHRGFNDGRAGRSILYPSGHCLTRERMADYLNGYEDGVRLRNARPHTLATALSEATRACMVRNGIPYSPIRALGALGA